MKEKNRDRTVRLGLTPLTGIAIFPHFYQGFRAVHPDIQIIAMEHGHRQARLMLEDGSMDASFTTHTEGLSENVGSMVLAESQLVFCVAASHPLAGRGSVSIRDICDEPLVYLSEGMQREREIKRLYRQAGRTPNIVLRMGQLNTLRNIVAERIAAAILFHGCIDDGEAVVGLPFDPPIRFPISLIWNRQSADREGVREMLRFAEKWYTEF